MKCEGGRSDFEGERLEFEGGKMEFQDQMIEFEGGKGSVRDKEYSMRVRAKNMRVGR